MVVACCSGNDENRRRVVYMGKCSECADFDPSFLIDYDTMVRDRILSAIRSEPLLTQPRTVELQQDILEGTFGTFSHGHAFSGFCPDWGIKLLERQATGGLAYLLGRGTGETRGLRIQAFLEALKVPTLPGPDVLTRARVAAEKKRVDVSIHLPPDAAGSSRIILVEAKFDDKIRKGQLKKYYNAYRGYDRDCRIIALSPNVASGLSGQQRGIWHILLWRDVWLRFEKMRPPEMDDQLAAFQAWLWQRIGGLNPRVS